MISTKSVAASALVAFLGVMVSASAQAQSVEEFYTKHNQIDLYLAQGPGSTYEIWGQVLQKFWPRYIPGHPNMIPRLMPGGGSLVMANYLYNQAAKDGTAIGMFSGSLPGQVMLGLNNVKLDLQKFQYIGSPQSSDNACVVLTKSGINSVEDAMKREVSLAGTGPTSTDGFLPPILNEMIGTKFHVIQGYQSSGEGFLAVDRGEVDGACFTLSTTQAMEGASLSNGSLKILFTTNEQRSLPDVPSIFEYVKSEEDRQILSFLQSSAMIGRPMAVPPSVPADRVEALRQAFEQMSKDPEFLAEVKSMNRLDFTFTSGAQLEKLVSNLLSTPQPVVARAKSFMPASQ